MIVGAGRGKITVNVDLILIHMILLVHSMIFKYQCLMQLDVEGPTSENLNASKLFSIQTKRFWIEQRLFLCWSEESGGWDEGWEWKEISKVTKHALNSSAKGDYFPKVNVCVRNTGSMTVSAEAKSTCDKVVKIAEDCKYLVDGFRDKTLIPLSYRSSCWTKYWCLQSCKYWGHNNKQ